jgi:hypothetical protein
MDALTRLHRSLAGGDDEEGQGDDLLGDTEDLCSLSPLQVRHAPPRTLERVSSFLVRVDLTCSACFALLSGSTPSRRAWLLDSPS